MKTSKAALMLSVLPMGKNGWLRRLVYRTRRGETGGLKLAPWREVREVATRGERLIHAVAERSFSPARQHDGGRGGGSGAPTEVRVSGDSIIEVYGVDGSREEHFGREQHNRERARGVYDGADWVESREARDESQHALARYWRVRRAKSLAAYAVFGALAALIVWFAVR